MKMFSWTEMVKKGRLVGLCSENLSIKGKDFSCPHQNVPIVIVSLHENIVSIYM